MRKTSDRQDLYLGIVLIAAGFLGNGFSGELLDGWADVIVGGLFFTVMLVGIIIIYDLYKARK